MKQSLRTGFSSILLFMSVMQAVGQVSVSGRVLGYMANRIGDYDGIRLQTATGEIHLLFPPHAAARIRQMAATRQRITADVEPGRAGPAPVRTMPDNEGIETERITYRLVRLRNSISGFTFQVSDVPPPAPRQGALVQAEGPLLGKLQDERGQLSALLTDKYLIEIKPHQAEQIGSLLVGVQRLGVAGFERTADGFVNRTGRPLLHPTTLTVRGQTFAL